MTDTTIVSCPCGWSRAASSEEAGTLLRSRHWQDAHDTDKPRADVRAHEKDYLTAGDALVVAAVHPDLENELNYWVRGSEEFHAILARHNLRPMDILLPSWSRILRTSEVIRAARAEALISETGEPVATEKESPE